ncbi:MAG: hypothetical protein HF967_05745 [Methanosarcinales archaeon]|jgi:predicted nucleotidyltransferase|nr:hypothetical protein [Methanosarcinales archaeon]
MEETEKSDIDIYADFYLEELEFDKYLELIEYLEHLFGKNRPYHPRWC